jgi:hypothetical protein
MERLVGKAVWSTRRCCVWAQIELEHHALQEIDYTVGSEYMNKKLAPVIVSVVIAVLVLVSYLLFILVSCCCKCCSSKRGFCQRPQQRTYVQRIPFIMLVVIPAVVGIIGAILVMAGGPQLVTAVKGLADGLIAQVPPQNSSVTLKRQICWNSTQKLWLEHAV